MREREVLYLVSYDISSDKKRRKIANELENYGQRVQYSVFECRLPKARFRKLYRTLLPLCTGEEDSIRIYSLCESCAEKITIIGNPGKPREDEDVIII